MWLPIAIVVLFIVLIVFAWLFFSRSFRRPATKDILDEDVLITTDLFTYTPVLKPALDWYRKQPWEDIELTAGDGSALHALWLPVRNAKTCMVMFHGYGGLPQDLCVFARWASKQSYHVLLVHQRAHGASGGEYCSLGLLEAEDACLWAEKAAELSGGCRIVLYGCGMGGYTVLHALSCGLPSAVAGVISEGAYSDPRDMIRHVMRYEMRMRVFPMLQLICLFGRILWKEAPGGSDLKDELGDDLDIPVLFIHGKKDIRVPFSLTEEMNKVCAAPKALYLSENAGHGACSLADGTAFFAEVSKFMKSLPAPVNPRKSL